MTGKEAKDEFLVEVGTDGTDYSYIHVQLNLPGRAVGIFELRSGGEAGRDQAALHLGQLRSETFVLKVLSQRLDATQVVSQRLRAWPRQVPDCAARHAVRVQRRACGRVPFSR